MMEMQGTFCCEKSVDVASAYELEQRPVVAHTFLIRVYSLQLLVDV